MVVNSVCRASSYIHAEENWPLRRFFYGRRNSGSGVAVVAVTMMVAHLRERRTRLTTKSMDPSQLSVPLVGRGRLRLRSASNERSVRGGPSWSGGPVPAGRDTFFDGEKSCPTARRRSPGQFRYGIGTGLEPTKA